MEFNSFSKTFQLIANERAPVVYTLKFAKILLKKLPGEPEVHERQGTSGVLIGMFVT